MSLEWTQSELVTGSNPALSESPESQHLYRNWGHRITPSPERFLKAAPNHPRGKGLHCKPKFWHYFTTPAQW